MNSWQGASRLQSLFSNLGEALKCINVALSLLTNQNGSMNTLSTYEERISQLAPEVSVNSITLNRDGLLNDVVIINGELIFRFPKHEYAFKHLKDEARLLRLLQNYITLDIPSPLYESDYCLAYRMIPGETLRRDMLMKLSEGDQQAIADQLAQFLKELHGLPINQITDFEIPLADALMKYEGWVKAMKGSARRSSPS